MATSVNNVNKKSIQGTNSTTPSSTGKSAIPGVATLPLVVIVGPTASGKSATAMRIAREWKGEIICSDSRTIYKDLDIGTAKPSAADRAEVPHWGLDVVQPGDVFTAADFKKYALKTIGEVRSRGHVPILVGGTGLYVDGVIFDYEFQKPQPELRQQLEELTLEELKEYCASNNIQLPGNEKNRRYVMRAIETKNTSAKRLTGPIDNTIIVGIATERDILRQRISDRAGDLFKQGMLEEALLAGEKYGWNNEAMTGNIYKLAHQYVMGELTKDELHDKFVTSDWRLAKRQLTWLKRNPYIVWKSLDDAYVFINNELALRQGAVEEK